MSADNRVDVEDLGGGCEDERRAYRLAPIGAESRVGLDAGRRAGGDGSSASPRVSTTSLQTEDRPAGSEHARVLEVKALVDKRFADVDEGGGIFRGEDAGEGVVGGEESEVDESGYESSENTDPLLGGRTGNRDQFWDGGAGQGQEAPTPLTSFGGVAEIFNAVAGPGIVMLPHVFQDSGWVFPVLVIGLMYGLTSFSATFFSDAIARIPGNSHLTIPTTYITACQAYIGGAGIRVVRVIALLALLGCSMAALSSASQIFDSCVVLATSLASGQGGEGGVTYAVEVCQVSIRVVAWSPPAEACEVADSTQSKYVPFQDVLTLNPGCRIVSVGYLTAVLLLAAIYILKRIFKGRAGSLPAKARFLTCVLLLLYFTGCMLHKGVRLDSLHPFGASYRWMVGSLIFCFAHISAVPPLLRRSKEGVAGVGATASVNAIVWGGAGSASAVMLVVGVVGAMSLDGIEGSFVNLLASKCSSTLTRACTGVFAVSVLLAGVPAQSARMASLLTAKPSHRAAALSILLPPLLAWSFYRYHAFSALISWCGMAFVAPANLVIPMLVSLIALDVDLLRAPCSSGEGGKSQGAFRIAGKSDIFDSSNRRTVIRPLPFGWHRYQRILSSSLFLATIGVVVVYVSMGLHCLASGSLMLKDWEC